MRLLLTVGGVMAFLGLLDYLTGETWLLAWRDHPFTGRLSGTFVNPDHFAAWLTMLILLGLGWLVARTSSQRRGPSLVTRLTVRELREQAVRRYLPMIAVIVMGVAVVFTLSRGGLVGLVAGLLSLVGLLSASGRARRSLVITATLLIVVVAYGGWIGFGPLVARLAQTPAGSLDRLTQYLASLPLLREFPILGVGLGAYRDIYFRHQPLATIPTASSFPTRTTICSSWCWSSAWSAPCCACSLPGDSWPISSARTCWDGAPVRSTGAKGPRPCGAIASASASRWARWPAPPVSPRTARSTSRRASRPWASWPRHSWVWPRWRCTRGCSVTTRSC